MSIKRPPQSRVAIRRTGRRSSRVIERRSLVLQNFLPAGVSAIAAWGFGWIPWCGYLAPAAAVVLSAGAVRTPVPRNAATVLLTQPDPWSDRGGTRVSRGVVALHVFGISVHLLMLAALTLPMAKEPRSHMAFVLAMAFGWWRHLDTAVSRPYATLVFAAAWCAAFSVMIWVSAAMAHGYALIPALFGL